MQFCEIHPIFFFNFFTFLESCITNSSDVFNNVEFRIYEFFIEYVMIYFSPGKQKAFSTGQTVTKFVEKIGENI